MKLWLGILVCALLASTLFASSAFAQKPVKEPLVMEPLEFPAGEVCAFPARLETLATNISIKTFPDGRTLITGRSTERVTNLASGESVDLKTSGSILITPLPNGDERIVARGRTIIYLFARDVGGPALFLATGRVDEVLDPEADVITSFRLSGQRRDLCAELASASP
jgi:hypothetical protein